AQGSVFKIQPTDPPSGSWAPSVSVRVNNATAFFPSHLEAGGDALAGAGQYELKLELFRIVAGVPQVVNLTDEGVEVKVLDGPAPAAPGPVPFVNAPNPNLLRVGGPASDVVGFRWVLHVDNNPCRSDIADVAVGASTAGPCGFVAYPAGPPVPEASIAFRAFHPNGFATFNFVVTKGSSGTVAEASAGGSVTQAVTASGFASTAVPAPGWFTKNVPVPTLLGDCPGKAAFAETIHVDALATDGWSTLEYLDADGPTKAFALEPAPPA
ncbi:MAG: hypothetical protein ACRDZW_11450, partial [Acidimicrobiales bacterium]